MFLPFVVPPERPDFTKEGRVPTATTRPAGDHGPIMRTPLDPRHTPVGLTVASPSEPAPEEHSRFPAVPWLLAAVAWTAAVALVGWVLVGALVSVSWLTAVHVPAAEVFGTIGQGWLVLHGVPGGLAGATVRLVPLGATQLLALGCGFAAHHAAAQYDLEDGAPRSQRAIAWASVVGACVGAYVLVGGILAVVVGSPGQLGQAIPGLLLVPLAGAAPGAVLGLGLDLFEGLPAWTRRLPRAIGLGVGVLALGSLAALVMTLVAHLDLVSDLHGALAPDGVGAVVLTLVQVAYLPNLLAWAGAFVLGAGVTLGPEGLVAPGVVEPTVLPAIPVLGAVPSVPGVADHAWLVVGLAAAAASAWWLLRGSDHAWLTGLWQGAVAGVAPGLAWIVFSLFSGGDLGVERLAGMGPRLPDLLLWATLPLAAAGALYGLGRALWLSRRSTPAPVEEPAAIG